MTGDHGASAGVDQLLPILRELDRTGSMLAVARRFDCSPPTIRAVIARAERRCGRALVRTSPNGTRLTVRALQLIDDTEALTAN